MGKLFIINSADFSINALGTSAIDGKLNPLVTSIFGWSMHKSTETAYDWGIRYNVYFEKGSRYVRRLFVYDVSMYAGHSITITRDIITPQGANGYYGGFIKDFPVGVSVSSLMLKPPTDGNMSYPVNDAVHIAAETSRQFGVSQTVTVPDGYKYLIITVPYVGGSHESSINWTCKCQVIVNN